MRGNALLQRAQNQLDGQRVLKLSTDHVEISERWVNGAGSLHTLLVSSVRLVGGIKLVASIRGVHVGVGDVVLLALGVGVLQCCGGGSGVAGQRCACVTASRREERERGSAEVRLNMQLNVHVQLNVRLNMGTNCLQKYSFSAHYVDKPNRIGSTPKDQIT